MESLSPTTASSSSTAATTTPNLFLHHHHHRRRRSNARPSIESIKKSLLDRDCFLNLAYQKAALKELFEAVQRSATTLQLLQAELLRQQPYLHDTEHCTVVIRFDSTRTAFFEFHYRSPLLPWAAEDVSAWVKHLDEELVVYSMAIYEVVKTGIERQAALEEEERGEGRRTAEDEVEDGANGGNVGDKVGDNATAAATSAGDHQSMLLMVTTDSGYTQKTSSSSVAATSSDEAASASAADGDQLKMKTINQKKEVEKSAGARNRSTSKKRSSSGKLLSDGKKNRKIET